LVVDSLKNVHRKFLNLIKRDFGYYKIGRHLGDAPANSSNDSIDFAGNGFI
jgi:hypothetical protein